MGLYMHRRLPVPDEPNTALHDASNIETVVGAYVDARNAIATE